jgi:multicomponent Na+:H+ antiporter subunit D
MNYPSALTPLPVAVPLAGAAVLACLRKWLSRAVADAVVIAFASATLIISAMLLVHSTHGATVYWFGNWFPRGSVVLGIGFLVEPVGAGLATLAALLTLLGLIFSWRFVNSGGNHFQPLMLVFLGAMSGFVLTADIFNLFVFFELMSTAAFALCGLKTEEPAPLQGAFNFAVTNTIAAFLVLTGIALLYAVTGALNMAQIGLALGSRHDPLVLFAFTLLTCGFLIKAAIVPFHLWLPDAHAVAPTPVCVLFSGVMVEFGLYAIVRLHSAMFAQSLAPHRSQLRLILLGFGVATVIVGSVMCYSEHHLKRMLAFSTISHTGLMVVAFAIQGPLAVAAMLTYLLAHAFIKSGLFFVSGILLHRLRSISEKELFGKGRAVPWTAALWFLGAAGLVAAPPFASMLAEAGVSHAADGAGVHGISVVFLFGGILTCAAVLRVGMHTFFGWGDGPITDRAAEVGELPETKAEDRRIFWYQFTPAAVCIFFAMALTFLPVWFSVLRDASAAIVDQSAYLHTVYTGQSVALMLPGWKEAIPAAAARGLGGLLLAILLACTSVFRSKLRRPLRLGAFVESGFKPLRELQSGHPGDYVLWITIGLAVFGSATMLMLRS